MYYNERWCYDVIVIVVCYDGMRVTWNHMIAGLGLGWGK